ncbi:MAG: hypothetical protein KTR31_18470 [Myxococcales bacterium]|nr:hypothetical protein [Myxococcales bacterium]
MVLAALLALSTALAGPDATRDALDRLEEVLELRLDEGALQRDEVLPAILVSSQPRYEESGEWFATRAIEVLQRSFGNEGLRLCEACMVPRAFVQEGRMAYQTGPIALDEVIRLDDDNRGDAQPARSAIWVDEHATGVAIRIVDLRTARVIFAQNVDPNMVEDANTQKVYSLAAELERRARRDSLTQAFVDAALYPGQHFSLDWTDQWGKRNENLSGFTLTFFDPVIGLGANHYRRIPFMNILVGGKVVVSLPTAVARVFTDAGIDVLDPLLSGVAVVRVPFGRSNYGVVVTASTNGQFGIGVSLMNISLLPFIP